MQDDLLNVISIDMRITTCKDIVKFNLPILFDYIKIFDVLSFPFKNATFTNIGLAPSFKLISIKGEEGKTKEQLPKTFS